MDRFVFKLKGQETEKLVRHSGECLATMKELGGTLDK